MSEGLRPELIEQFDHQGFINAGKILDLDDVELLGEELDKIIAKGPEGFEGKDEKPVLFRNMRAGTDENAVWQIVNVWEASGLFKHLLYHPTIVKAISQLTGFDNLQVWHDQVQYKPAETGGHTGWHQDAPLWPSIEPMTPVWIPFDDADIENGCMWMVPGSHKWGNQMEYLRTQTMSEMEEFFAIGSGFEVPADSDHKNVRAVPCPVKKGAVHFHHSLTWHGSPKNHSPRKRRALAIHYMTSEAVFTGRDHAMRPFIEVAEGEAMANAGAHFPKVMENGKLISPE